MICESSAWWSRVRIWESLVVDSDEEYLSDYESVRIQLSIADCWVGVSIDDFLGYQQRYSR